MPAQQATEYIKVSPDNLLFDVSNPRFGGVGSTSGNRQDDILDHLKRDPHFATELIDSFVVNGFIPYEPLIVKPSGKKWVVVEGNRRLAAIKTILADTHTYNEATRKRLTEIPVITFPSASSADAQNDLRIYLGVRHLFGYREWPPLSKAKFLDSEITKLGVDRIAKEIGISKQEIRRFVVPLRILKSKVSAEIEDDFWVLGEALSRTNIQRFIDLDVDPNTFAIKSYDTARFDELLDFLYGRKVGKPARRDSETKAIGETRDLKTLAAVVVNKPAMQALRKGKSLEIAADFIDTKPQKLKRLKALTDRLAVLVKQLTDGSETEQAIELKSAMTSFSKAAKRFVTKNG
jgi:hypothetical protein